jgi:hypothetical protein
MIKSVVFSAADTDEGGKKTGEKDERLPKRARTTKTRLVLRISLWIDVFIPRFSYGNLT